MSERGTVVLVGADGTVRGVAPKLDAHRPPGELHLAFSVFLYRPDGSLLLQRRAAGKYHFPGVWANACCSHPGPGEDLVTSAELRVKEELGLSCALLPVGAFVYRAEDPTSGLVEHELDHVLVGRVLDEPRPDPDEVDRISWEDPGSLLGRLAGADGAGSGGDDRPGEGSEGIADGPFAPWLLPALRLAEAGRGRSDRGAGDGPSSDGPSADR